MAEKSISVAAKTNAANELVFTRTYDAPCALVFAAWTDPQHIGRWWGPEGFTTTTHAMEVKLGGVWDYVMHGPDGTDYPGRSVYTEIEKPERLAFSNVGGKADDPHLTCEMSILFEEAQGKTKLTLRMLFPSAEAAEHARELGAEVGGTESLERLAKVLREATD
ncbi:ATPase [Pelagibius litoralis]|uniref:ATPase n=1 Tax=Pelagibius litoralis TaxID=374515 RepID=A0A967F191_9PROT|nr:SRPBCC family protein [Pelagibius litoralis]NIA71106.1 ATPase [Pelagibius litoralis]